jgi:DNA-binding GntR family transcriptional regulator
MKPVTTTPVLSEQVRSAIVDAIVEGDLRSGERLAQEDIARRLGVSRQPVSHALEVLKQQGVLVELGRKGLTVAPMEPDRLKSLYEIRASLDALAARGAAEQVKAGDADTEVLDSLRTLVEQHARPPGKRTLAELVGADVAFHVALYRLSGNPWLEEITRPHWVHFRRSMHAVLEDRTLRGEVWPEHSGVLDAVLTGNPDRAARLAEQHARTAGETTASRLTARAQVTENTT